MARIRGDTTAQDQGRLTLNPLAHADPLGTLLLPALGALFQFPILGWAKPVPVDPRRLRNPKWDYVLVSIAGPLANLLLCAACIGGAIIYDLRIKAFLPESHFLFPLVRLMMAMVYINAILAVFNLIPLPPLDGAAVLMAFLPNEAADAYQRTVAPYGFIILLVLLISGGLNWIAILAMGYVQVVLGLLSKTLTG